MVKRPTPHGTTTGYSHYKCRCPECRAAVARYNNARQKAMRAGTWEPTGKAKPVLRQCIGPGCNRLAKYSTKPLCGGHLQQHQAGKPLTALRRKDFPIENGEKVCSICLHRKPIGEFHRKKETVVAGCKACLSIYTRARRYGVSFDEMAAMIGSGTCDSCGDPVAGLGLHIDHCHDTGKVRGVLCGPCNTALGCVRDDVERLRHLVAYLTR